MTNTITPTNLPTLRQETAHTLVRLAAALTDGGASLDATFRAAEDLLALAHSEESVQARQSSGPTAALLAERADTINTALVGVVKAEFAIRKATAEFRPTI